jgi:hypothetical protein
VLMYCLVTATNNGTVMIGNEKIVESQIKLRKTWSNVTRNLILNHRESDPRLHGKKLLLNFPKYGNPI